MIGVVVRELTYLKILAPIMRELRNLGQPYVLYHFDAPRGDKEYNRATRPKMIKAAPEATNGAVKIKAFANDTHLLQQLVHDKITKLVSIEIWLWAKSYTSKLKAHNIKTYSVLYLTDSLWQKNPSCVTSMDRVYYSTKYLMETHHEFAGVQFDPNRDRCLGSPALTSGTGNPTQEILVLLPNLRKEHVGVSFGSAERFINLIAKLARGGDLLFKTRKKQWLPNEIRQYAKEIVEDGDLMDPPVITELLNRCSNTVMFYSSGIYECVYAGHYVYNIPFSLKRWGWDKEMMKKYFSVKDGSLYNFSGVVESLDQERVLRDDWEFRPRLPDRVARKRWLQKFTGASDDAPRRIALDIVNG